MRNLLPLLLLAVIVSFAATWSAQSIEPQLDAVGQALATGDVPGVTRLLDETVELVLPGTSDIVSRGEAQRLLAGFFRSSPPQSFSRVHGGTSSGASGSYLIGTLVTEPASYRVYVYGLADGDGGVVQELRIEAE